MQNGPKMTDLSPGYHAVTTQLSRTKLLIGIIYIVYNTAGLLLCWQKRATKEGKITVQAVQKPVSCFFFVIFSSIYLQMSFFFCTFVAILCVCTYARMHRLCVEKGQNRC